MQSDLFTVTAPLPRGVSHWPARLDLITQIAILNDIAQVMNVAPPFRPRMRNGTPMINSLTNCGTWGWLSDEKGYRYEKHHPLTGELWPSIPETVLTIARNVAAEIGFADYHPDACLVNIYAHDGKLNLHRDEDEKNPHWPIISFSFGADAPFVLGGLRRTDRTQTIPLASGDIMSLYGESRMRFHGVKKIGRAGVLTHPTIPPGGRINLTVRRAT